MMPWLLSLVLFFEVFAVRFHGINSRRNDAACCLHIAMKWFLELLVQVLRLPRKKRLCGSSLRV